jgi:hypothetical protein
MKMLSLKENYHRKSLLYNSYWHGDTIKWKHSCHGNPDTVKALLLRELFQLRNPAMLEIILLKNPTAKEKTLPIWKPVCRRLSWSW